MATFVVILLSVIVFVGQIMLCFRFKKTHVRAIPAMAMTALMALSGFAYILGSGIYGASFAAVVYAVILAILLAVDAMGWLTYCIIRFIQKVS